MRSTVGAGRVMGVVLGVALVASACESTTHEKASARSSATATAAATTPAPVNRSGPIQVFVEDAPPESLGGVNKQWRAQVQAEVEVFNADVPAGGRKIRYTPVPYVDDIYGPCRPIAGPRPDIVLSGEGGAATVRCEAPSGVPVLSLTPERVAAATLAAHPGWFLAHGVTQEDLIATTISLAPELPQFSGVTHVGLALTSFDDPASGITKAQEEAAKAAIVQDTGLPVSAWRLADPNSDVGSFQAKMTVLAAKLRSQHVDGLIGFTGVDPFPFSSLKKQRFTPPILVTDDAQADGEAQTSGFPLDRIIEVSAQVGYQSDASTRKLLQATEGGRTCLSRIDRNGQLAASQQLTQGIELCDSFRLLQAALAKDPAALDSSAAFAQAVNGVELQLSYGPMVSFGGRRTGLVTLDVRVGNPACSCFATVRQVTLQRTDH